MMRGHFMPMQLVQSVLDRLMEYGRLIVPCPVQPGHYYLKNFHVDETQMPMYRLLRENVVFILELQLSQEVVGKEVSVFEFQGFGMCNKSNWP
jgi:Protein of unknown function (DUF1091)